MHKIMFIKLLISSLQMRVCYTQTHMLTIVSVNNINWPYRKLYMILYTNIDQHLVNSLHGLNCEIGGLECRVITTEYYI